MDNEKKNGELIQGRFDFIMVPEEIVAEDGKSTTLKVKLMPDPKRYEWLEKNGEQALSDKYTGTLITWAEFSKALENAKAIPIVHTSPKQLDFCEYLKDQKREILKHWDEKYIIKNSIDSARNLLEDLQGKESYIVILYVDMEGSTRLSSQVDSDTYTKIIKLFLMQMAKIIDNFKGYVLKFVGDCAIGIFPAEGNFPNTCDNSVQAAILMQSVIEDVINPILLEKNLPQIGFHIGLDIGLAQQINLER